MVSMGLSLIVIQDNAPAYTAASTIGEMSQRQICHIFWPINSPNLNPTEAVWDVMKDYIQQNHLSGGGGKRRSQDSLRKILKEAWDSLSSEDLVRLIESMPSRFQGLKDADGGPTKL